MNAMSLVHHPHPTVPHAPMHRPSVAAVPPHFAPSHASVVARRDGWKPYGPARAEGSPKATAETGAAHTTSAPESARPAEKAMGMITNLLEQSVSGLTAETARQRMMEKYQALRLMDDQGQWTVPELARYSDRLLPSNLDGARMKAFVGEMAGEARKNPYLMKFLDSAASEDFPALREKAAAEGQQVFPDVLLHAQVLDRLTGVLADDYQNSKACREHWKKCESDPAFWQSLSGFQKAKLVSVNMGIDNLNEMHDAGKADPKALDFVLPLNIMEAVAADAYHGTISDDGKGAREGHRGNAYAGWILATHGPHGEGPSGFSPDGRMIELHQKETKAWDDLYQTWNMDFVTICHDWPYWMTKLTIPEVGGYADRPAEYINKRALALHLTMTMVALLGKDGKMGDINWTDRHLSDVWGKVNAESAKEYAALAR